MTTETLHLTTPFAITHLFQRARRASPHLMRHGLVMLIGVIAMMAMQQVDARLFNGVSIWHKPAKFFLSLGVHFITVAWALSYLGPTRSRAVRGSIFAMIVAGWLEMVYICARAWRGEASHFNIGTPLDAALYTLMGLGAVTITISTLIIGLAILRRRDDSLMAEAAGIGLVIGAVLATLVGGYLSSQSGHWVGGDQTDATGLAILHWSTTGGDLRVAHFIGLHAMQIVPFAALSGNHTVTYASAVLVIAATAATFAQAVLGIPVLRL